MPSKRGRRQERRRHHQLAQAERKRERSRVARERTEQVLASFARLRSAAEDEGVEPEDFAASVFGLMGDELTGGMLADHEFGADQGHRVGLDVAAERGRQLTDAVVARLDEEPRLVWFAAALAETAEDTETAEQILEGVVEHSQDKDAAADAAVWLGRLWLAEDMLADAIDLIDREAIRSPGHEGLQGLRAHCLSRASLLVAPLEDAAEPLSEADEAERAALVAASSALARFEDRSLLYALREAMEAFVAADPGLLAWRDERVAEFLAEARRLAGLDVFDELGGDRLLRFSTVAAELGLTVEGGDAGTPGGGEEALGLLATERTWLSAPEGDAADRDLSDDETLLGRFASAGSTPALLAAAARDWLSHVRYGLWQPQLPPLAARDPNGADWRHGGVWLVDIVTRRRVFAALPYEQVEGLPRWVALAGPLVPIRGIWRSGGAMLVLEPTLADRAADAMLETAEAVAMAIAKEKGLKVPRRPKTDWFKREHSRPHGVLADILAPMDRFEADLTAKATGAAFGHLVGLVEAEHRRKPEMHNTDGDPIELLRATYPTPDPFRTRKSLLRHEDFEGDDDESDGSEDGEVAPPLRWLGRDMTPDEAQSSLAQFRAEAKRQGWGPVPEPTGPRRWVRGFVRFRESAVFVEVNSRRRFELVSELLSRAGAGEPTVEYVLDPGMDFALPGGRFRTGAAGGPESQAAWRELWYDQSLPALSGATPREAARGFEGRVLLETLLRQFEHDADEVALGGERALDVGTIRAELRMESGVYGDEDEDGDEDGDEDNEAD